MIRMRACPIGSSSLARRHASLSCIVADPPPWSCFGISLQYERCKPHREYIRIVVFGSIEARAHGLLESFNSHRLSAQEGDGGRTEGGVTCTTAYASRHLLSAPRYNDLMWVAA